jgi:hypothetical protein
MIKTLFVLALLAATPAAAQHATSSSFFGPNGSFAGSAITRGSSTSFYGPNGNFTGSSTRVGNTTTFYGPKGNYQGSVIRPTGSSNHPLMGGR